VCLLVSYAKQAEQTVKMFQGSSYLLSVRRGEFFSIESSRSFKSRSRLTPIFLALISIFLSWTVFENNQFSKFSEK